MDVDQFQWLSLSSSSKSVSHYENSAASKTTAASTFASSSAAAHEVIEHFPPPPAHLLQEAPECSASKPQEPASQSRQTANREQHYKSKSKAELKRLYKHIHPEVRKSLEAEYLSELSQAELECEEMGDVQQACYMFEKDRVSPCSSPDRDSVEWDEILKGEVQSVRWMFENKPLDTIKDESPDESEGKSIAQQEIIAGKDVKYTAWIFETQPMDALGTETTDSAEESQKSADFARGDVRTATWLFETQPLDCLNKIYQEDELEAEVVTTRDIAGGDVKTARYLFETQHLDSFGKTETIEESHFLSLKSELEEIKGDVKTTTRVFETQPMCVIRGDSGEILEVTTISREETEKGDVKTSRWMFETQPLDMINKDPAKVKLICGISVEDNVECGVNRGTWLFETKTLDTINDEEWECSRKQKEEIIGADVRKHCLVFETQPMDTLKDNTNARPVAAEEIVGGDVQSAKHLFETAPMEKQKDLLEVGKLKKMVASEEEKGDVRHQKWVFESQPLENIREEKKEIVRTVHVEALDKGDVTNYKERFESMDLGKCDGTQRIQVEGVTSGSVKSNKELFESTPMYAVQDSAGRYHELRRVRREEIVKGDVRSCRWMFETRPIDEFDESINKFQIIKGISKQEVQSGDVKTAKWLFETQQLDAIKYFHNFEAEEHKMEEGSDIEKGDVKTCRWLFETRPLDGLYEKAEKNEADIKDVEKGDVKTCTWLFETQTLDAIRDHTESETILKTCTVKEEDIQGKDVRLARFLFETENLENITGEDSGSFRKVTEINIQSGDVSRMKYIFENRSSDIMSSTSEETMQRLKLQQAEDIQRGNVVNCTWMFENQPIDAIREEARDVRTVTDVQGGNVDQGRFIFETYSLDQIKEESSDMSKITSIFRDESEKGDVKNYTMMFENQPLYAIRDKEGHYHEVTAVTKEEVMRGDVVGSRWLFETKPLDSIRDSEEVYVIKSVTEEDVNKGDVSSARWKFETQPLDEITDEIKVRSKTVADIQGGDVKTNKQRFETDEVSQKYIRTVSVSEIQKGDVRSATWMFETRTIDEIHSEGVEYDGMETVTKEEVMKGDVKQSVWLFEKQPLDSIKDGDGTELVVTKEEIPQADVKTTTWLFETTPFHHFNETKTEQKEIIGKSIKETLEELYCQKMVDSQGILIEADEIGDVRMAKYKLMNQEAPQIQREEIIRGDLSNIMMNLLTRRELAEKGITIDEEERGNVNTTLRQLFNQERGINFEKEEIIAGDIQEAISSLFKNEGSSKRGILIQENEKGDVKMTIYSLLNKGESTCTEKEDIIHGNVSRTLHRLLSSTAEDERKKIKVGDTERGNVSFYSTCIESGALDYLKQLQCQPDDAQEKVEKECIIGGDIEGTKILLRKNQQQIGRTVAEDDIVPGDVHNTVKVFITEPAVTYRNLEKEDIVKGDLCAALDSLTQAINQKVVIEKEQVVKGDIPSTLKCLEEAQHQAKEMEKPEIVRGDIRGALESLEKSVSSNVEATIEGLVAGDVKGTLKSLEEAKNVVKEVEKVEIVKGDILTAMQSLHEMSNEKKLYQHQVSEQGDVKGTIQLLLDPATTTEGRETPQVEKEEVVKGDVQGAIKCLMQRKQHSNPKRMHPPKKAKVPVRNPSAVKQVGQEYSQEAKSESTAGNPAPAVKNLSQSRESQEHTQRHNESKWVKTQVTTQEDRSLTAAKTRNATGTLQQKSLKEELLKAPPPQKIQVVKAHYGKKRLPKHDQMESKTADVNMIQNTSKANISNKQICETMTVKQVQATVIEKSVRRKETVTVSEQMSHKQTEKKAAAQKQSFKNMKSEYCSLDMVGKGVIKKPKPEIYFPPPPSSPPPPSESELSLPPPPSPVLESPTSSTSQPSIMRQDSDLPPPPPPPPLVEGEGDFFPPPPPMLSADFLPPPPSQQELNAMPRPAPTKLAKPTGRPLFKVPHQAETQKQPVQRTAKWQKKQPAAAPPPQLCSDPISTTSTVCKEETTVEEKKKETVQQENVEQIESESVTKSIPLANAVQKESPKPPKKAFVSPIKLPPTPEPAPASKPRPYARKFKTPLMLAEERYRQQKLEKERTETSAVTTPTSPPINIASFAASSEPSAQNPEEEVTAEVTKAAMEGRKTDSTEDTSAQEVLTKKTASQIPLSKPLIPAANKKSVPKSSSVSVDEKHILTEHSREKVFISADVKKRQNAPENRPVPCLRDEISNANVQARSTAVTSSVSEQQRFIQKSSTENASFQIQAQKSEVTQILPLTQEGQSSSGPSQPSKIPKVTPSFKVKTFKMPAEKREDKRDSLGQKESMKSEMQLERGKCSVSQRTETKASAESRQLTSASADSKAELKLKEKKSQMTLPIKEAEVEFHMERGLQAHGSETEAKPPASVTALMPKTGKITNAAAHQGRGLVSVARSQQSVETQHVHRHEEVVLTESLVQRERHTQRIALQATESNDAQMTEARSKDEPKQTSSKGKGKIVHKDRVNSEEITDSEKCNVIQKLLVHIGELEGTTGKVEPSAATMIIAQIPDWMMGLEEKRNLSEIARKQSNKKLKEMMGYVKKILLAKLPVPADNPSAGEDEKRGQEQALPPPPAPPKLQKRILSGAPISKMSAGRSDGDGRVLEEKQSLQQSRVDSGVSSPLMSIRTPSPTFISIESRKVDSPARVTPPPHKSAGTPPPPPRKSFTPTSSFIRASPSPTLSRSEKLVKLKDSSTKVSHSVTPPPPPPPPPPVTVLEPVVVDTEKSTSFGDREVRAEEYEQKWTDVSEMVDSMATVRDKKSFFEEAQKADVNKVYIRKDPIDIPERLGPDVEEESVTFDLLKEDLPRVDLSKLVNRFESTQPKVYTRKEPIVISERLGSDTEDAETDRQTARTEDVPMFTVKAIKDVFEAGEHSSQAARELREQIERRESGSVFSEAAGLSETSTVSERFCSVDEFGNTTRSAMHSGSSMTHVNPPSYADVVRGNVAAVPADASAEELLRNLQQSWAESQGVFQNLGFSVTQQRTSQIVTHQRETVVTGKPSCTA